MMLCQVNDLCGEVPFGIPPWNSPYSKVFHIEHVISWYLTLNKKAIAVSPQVSKLPAIVRAEFVVQVRSKAMWPAVFGTTSFVLWINRWFKLVDSQGWSGERGDSFQKSSFYQSPSFLHVIFLTGTASLHRLTFWKRYRHIAQGWEIEELTPMDLSTWDG